MNKISPDLNKIDNILMSKNSYRISECNRIKCIVLFSTKYGICKMTASNILKGCDFSINSAVDKTMYFKNRANEIHGSKYDYSKVNYIKSSKKVIISCGKHGDFLQTPSGHLSGKGCNQCSVELSSKRYSLKYNDFLIRATELFGNKYVYDIGGYTNATGDIKIFCKKHGWFKQRVYSHLNGHGCRKCSMIGNKNPSGWTKESWIKSSGEYSNIYLIKVFNKKENFLKIGITKRKLNERFRGRRFPYKYEEILVMNLKSGIVYDMEKFIKSKMKEYRYIPDLKFSGHRECFILEAEGKLTALMTQ